MATSTIKNITPTNIIITTNEIARIYKIFSEIPGNAALPIRLSTATMSVLTGEAIDGGYGTVIKYDVENNVLKLAFDICIVNGFYRYAFMVNVSNTTITPGTVCRYSGTAIN